MKNFNQDIRAGIKNGSIPKTGLQRPGPQGFPKNEVNVPVINTTVETKMLGFAENLTSSLQQKGVDVTNLDIAITDAQNRHSER